MNPAQDRLGRLVVGRPVAVLMVFLAAVVFGGLSYSRLPVTLMPELDYPTLTVRTEYPGAAPQEVESDVSRPIEEALGVVGGLVRISSISRADLSDVVLEFGWNADISEATQEILEKLDLVVLPHEALRPLILHYDPSLDPVLDLSLSGSDERFQGDAGQRRLRRLAELQVRREIEPIEGVAAVRIRGGLEEEIHVLLREEQLRRTGISIEQVIDRLAQENVNLAGGMIEEGRTEFMVRTLGEFTGVDQIATTVVDIVDGREVRLQDIGRVLVNHRDREVYTRTDGGESVQIEVYKEADTNIVALSGRVRGVIEGSRGMASRLRAEEGADLRVVADRSSFIQASIDDVRRTALLGGVLATLVLFLFLRSFLTTAIVFLSIPISLLVTFAPLNLLDVSLNIMSLGGLALGIGMLVDNSIVVLESIHRCREEGDSPFEAAVRGTREVRAAVTASTLTTIAVFFPMVFVQGVAGQAFGDLGLAVVVSLLASLAVAVFFIPMLAGRETGGRRVEEAAEEAPGRSPWRFGSVERFRSAAARPGAAAKLRLVAIGVPSLLVGVVLDALGKLLFVLLAAVTGLVILVQRVAVLVVRVVTWPAAAATDGTMRALGAFYPRLLRACLAHPVAVLAIVVVSSWGAWEMFRASESELLPEVRQGEFTVEVELPVGTPVEQTDSLLAPVERAILSEREHIRSLLLTVGRDPSRAETSEGGEHTAQFRVLLEPGAGPALEDRVVERLRGKFVDLPDVEARIARPVLFSFKTPIEVEVRADDLDVLRDRARRVQSVMSEIPALADVELSLRRGAPEIQINPDRSRLAAYDLKIGEVARLVQSKVRGTEATRLNLVDRRVPIIVRLAPEDRRTIEDIRGVVVNPGGERVIPLSAVAEISMGEAPSEIRRIDGRRVAVVSANIAQGSLSEAVTEIDRRVRSELGDDEVTSFAITGQSEEWDRSRSSLLLALGLSVFLVYVIMAAQFESMTQPLVIMFSIPLAFVGSLAAIRLTGLNLSIVVFLGMIMLAGIVVNNAIVLIDYVNRLRARGAELESAILTAGRVRLRPILMTTVTTILGLLPMALGLGQGAELRTPMAIAVIGGLVSSTALTLVVVPTFYALAERALDAIWRRLRGPLRDPEAAGAGGSGPFAP